MTITAAADGSSLGNPGPAGWAWYVDEDTWDAGGWPKGTNNLGELTAILRLLQATAETGDELHILADSQYAINVVSKWRLGSKVTRRPSMARSISWISSRFLMGFLSAFVQPRFFQPSRL